MKLPTAISASLLALSLFGISAIPTMAVAAVSNPDATLSPNQEQGIAGFGPLDPSPPTGLTPEQIIQKFAARESEFSRARQNYIFRQSVKVQTISEDTNR